jgi:hypothetical protein
MRRVKQSHGAELVQSDLCLCCNGTGTEGQNTAGETAPRQDLQWVHVMLITRTNFADGSLSMLFVSGISAIVQDHSIMNLSRQ